MLAYGVLACYLSTLVGATALTYKLTPNEKACFFTWVDAKAAKVAFYFAVRGGLALCLSRLMVVVDLSPSVSIGGRAHRAHSTHNSAL